MPTLILRGDDDQIVPIDASARQSTKLVKGARLAVYEGADHGICSTRKDRVNQDLLAFFQEQAPARKPVELAGSGVGKPA